MGFHRLSAITLISACYMPSNFPKPKNEQNNETSRQEIPNTISITVRALIVNDAPDLILISGSNFFNLKPGAGKVHTYQANKTHCSKKKYYK
ncbi:hypothetical protein BEL04_12045 [Mucilaginibacter sp. PPCGB 2223]|nr:hypothetical protein BEL04_12045 [Mucilaginibacter sp. PPCGB 2223]